MFEDLKKRAKELRKSTFEAFVEKGEAHLGGVFRSSRLSSHFSIVQWIKMISLS